MRYVAVILGLAAVVLAANNSPRTISKKEFIDLYVKLSLVAEQYISQPDSLQAKQDSIFKTEGITREQFDSFREATDQTPEEWKDIWKTIVAKLDSIAKLETKSEKADSTVKPVQGKTEQK